MTEDIAEDSAEDSNWYLWRISGGREFDVRDELQSQEYRFIMPVVRTQKTIRDRRGRERVMETEVPPLKGYVYLNLCPQAWNNLIERPIKYLLRTMMRLSRKDVEDMWRFKDHAERMEVIRDLKPGDKLIDEQQFFSEGVLTFIRMCEDDVVAEAEVMGLTAKVTLPPGRVRRA